MLLLPLFLLWFSINTHRTLDSYNKRVFMWGCKCQLSVKMLSICLLSVKVWAFFHLFSGCSLNKHLNLLKTLLVLPIYRKMHIIKRKTLFFLEKFCCLLLIIIQIKSRKHFKVVLQTNPVANSWSPSESGHDLPACREESVIIY